MAPGLEDKEGAESEQGEDHEDWDAQLQWMNSNIVLKNSEVIPVSSPKISSENMSPALSQIPLKVNHPPPNHLNTDSTATGSISAQ